MQQPFPPATVTLLRLGGSCFRSRIMYLQTFWYCLAAYSLSLISFWASSLRFFDSSKKRPSGVYRLLFYVSLSYLRPKKAFCNDVSPLLFWRIKNRIRFHSNKIICYHLSIPCLSPVQTMCILLIPFNHSKSSCSLHSIIPRVYDAIYFNQCIRIDLFES
jgi:hypothetical protein